MAEWSAEAARERLNKATMGPWFRPGFVFNNPEGHGRVVAVVRGVCIVGKTYEPLREGDATFIEHAWNDLDKALDTLTRERAAWEQERAGYKTENERLSQRINELVESLSALLFWTESYLQIGGLAILRQGPLGDMLRQAEAVLATARPAAGEGEGEGYAI